MQIVDKIRTIEIEKRGTLRCLSHNLDLPVYTVHRQVKNVIIKCVDNKLKLSLNEKQKATNSNPRFECPRPWILH